MPAEHPAAVLHHIFPTKKTDPELAPFRSGLVFGFFNALTWQVGLGTPLVLFAQQLGATPLQVGLATSFVLLLTPIQVLSTALLPRYGFKKVMLGGWGTRSIFLVVPIVLAALAPWWGVRGWMAHTLVWSVFFFCLCRSVGAASFNPWIYAIVPVTARGRYFANDQFVASIGSVVTLLTCAGLFALLPVYHALLIQYAIALMGSTLSFFALKKLPDGPKPTAIGVAEVLRDTPRHIFSPGLFRRYLWIVVWYSVISTPIPAFIAYYLKSVPGFSMGEIIGFEVVRYLGVFLAAGTIRHRIDRAGAKPFLMMSLGLYLAVSVFWWAFLRGGFGGVPGVIIAYLFLGMGVSGWTIANLGYLPKIVPEGERPLMVSIHGAVTSCLGGCAPIVWGWFLKDGTGAGAAGAIDVSVFGCFFVVVAVSAVALLALVGKLPENTEEKVEPLTIGSAVMRPFRAMSYLVNLVLPPTRAEENETTDRDAGGERR